MRFEPIKCIEENRTFRDVGFKSASIDSTPFWRNGSKNEQSKANKKVSALKTMAKI